MTPQAWFASVTEYADGHYEFWLIDPRNQRWGQHDEGETRSNWVSFRQISNTSTAYPFYVPAARTFWGAKPNPERTKANLEKAVCTYIDKIKAYVDERTSVAHFEEHC